MFDLNKNNWPEFQFSEIAEQISERIDPAESDAEVYVGLEHIEPNSIHIKEYGKPSDVKGTKLKVYKGDIIFGKRRAYQRKAAIANFDGICSAHAMVLRAKPKIMIPELFPFFLHSDAFMNRAIDISEGSLSPTIKWKILAKQKFTIPPLDEQKKLADLLWAGDELVHKYIQEFNNILIYKNKYFRENYQLDNSNKKDKVSSLFELNPSKEKLSNDQIVSFISMEDVTEDGKIENKTDRKYEEVSTGYKSFTDGDILFAKITPCMENGKGAIASDLTNGCGFGSTEFHILRPINDFDRSYIYHLSQAPFFRLLAEKQMTGSAGQKRVPSDFLLNFKLNLPTSEKRMGIGNKMNSFDQILDLINKNIAATKRINDEIKNKVFS